ncbi:hypothetical protein [Mesoaciditoga lauensis]|uniref:hypothetical protein n=1 Tax=Mesoaciditoga lauensis TaxID=1495039 RepID=UPI000561EE27|nr:hypothetical protein [Mesoaciditoga lauensis]
MNFKKYFILFSFFLVIMVAGVFAVGGLYITPLVENLHGAPGSEITFKTSITNQANVQLKAPISFKDFYIDSNGNYSMTTFASYTHSCAAWITAPSTAPIISAGQSIEMPFTVHIPSNAAGEYFAAILINNTPPHQTGKIIVGVNTAILVKVTIDNVPPTHRAVFKDAKIYNTMNDKLPPDFPSSMKNVPYVLKITYKNIGNAVVGLDGQLRIISDTLHKIVMMQNVEREKTLAFPDITRTVWIPIDRIMPNGNYRVLISADLGNHTMVSKSFKVKLSGQKASKFPLLKFDKNVLVAKFERPKSFLNMVLNVESLDYRKSKIKSTIVGMKELKDGSIVEATLDKEVFGNFKVYPNPVVVYPYSSRRMVIAGKGPAVKPVDGDHYALLKMEESVIGEKSTSVRIPIILEVGKLTKSIALKDFRITPNGTETNVSLDIENTGNSLTYYAGQVFVTNEKDVTVLKNPQIISRGVLYANTTVSRSLTLPVKVEKGYSVRVVMYYFTDENFKNIASVSVQQKIK